VVEPSYSASAQAPKRATDMAFEQRPNSGRPFKNRYKANNEKAL
jgi:hypothetical protein